MVKETSTHSLSWGLRIIKDSELPCLSTSNTYMCMPHK